MNRSGPKTKKAWRQQIASDGSSAEESVCLTEQRIVKRNKRRARIAAAELIARTTDAARPAKQTGKSHSCRSCCACCLIFCLLTLFLFALVYILDENMHLELCFTDGTSLRRCHPLAVRNATVVTASFVYEEYAPLLLNATGTVIEAAEAMAGLNSEEA